MITYIAREKLEAHPDNPRKELGDLSELAASIRKQGLLQNLTVVPHPEKAGKYRIVIGHRRFSAAGIAGLNELPCVIDEHMSYTEQLAVMMSENMQRNDLTIAERVGGVQLMMDLGMSTAQVAANTGISDSSVRRYAKLAALDRKDMKKAEQRGVTLLQLNDICAIENEAIRQEALEKAGTAEYHSVMNRARMDAARRNVRPKVLEKLRSIAGEGDTKPASTRYIGTVWYDQKNALEDTAKMIAHIERAGKEYVFRENVTSNPSSVTLYMVVDQTVEDAEAARRTQERERIAERVRGEKEVSRRFGQMRAEWIRNVSLRWKEPQALRFVLWAISRVAYLEALQADGEFDYAFVVEAQKETTSTKALVLDTSFIEAISDREMLQAVVLAAFDRISRGDMTMIDRYTGKPKDGATVKEMYAMLEPMGYEMCAEEREWLAGEHECFKDPEVTEG